MMHVALSFVNAKRRKLTSNYCDHCEIELIHLNPCVQFEFTRLTQPSKLDHNDMSFSQISRKANHKTLVGPSLVHHVVIILVDNLIQVITCN